MPRAVVYFAVILLLVCSASAQSARKGKLSYKLLSIHVKGLARMHEEDVIRASGLKIGEDATEQDFQQAVKTLGDTGLFTNVAYNYRYTGEGCDLGLQVAENDKLVPILFDNLVWFTDYELISTLRSRVPLFDGKLPLSGELADEVAGTLNVVLAERKIAGHAEGIETASMGGPIDSYTYAVKFHPVIVRNMDFPGAGPDEVTALQAAAKAISGQEYLRSAMRTREKLDLLPVYMSRGYLKARFDDAQTKIVSDGPRTVVDVSFPVNPGLQYRVTDVQWAGAQAFPVQQLQGLIHLHSGGPANAVQLASDLEAVQKLYGTTGYLTAQVTPEPKLDDSAATVAYQLHVGEGDVFRMGDLEIDGIDQAAAAKLIAQWQIKNGDVFDDSYLQRFFQIMYHDFGLNRSYTVVPKQTINREAKTVNIELHFVPKK